MEITFQDLFNIATMIIWVLAGFIVKRTFKTLDHLELQDEKLSEQITLIKVALPTNYATNGKLETGFARLHDKLDRLHAKLDLKQDKGVDFNVNTK